MSAAPLCLEALSPSGRRVTARVGPSSPAEAAVALEAAAAPAQLEAFTSSYLAGDLKDGEPLQFAHAFADGRTVPVTVDAPTVLAAVEALRVLGRPSLLADVMAQPAAA